MSERPHIDVDALATAVSCPRQYRFAHVEGLESEDDSHPLRERFELLRASICAGLASTVASDETSEEQTVTALEASMRSALLERWAEHEEPFHSRTQRRHERRVLEATVHAYLETIGETHASGLERLRVATDTEATLVGPKLALSSRVECPDADDVVVDAHVDYLTTTSESIVGVRFVPTLAAIGPLRFRNAWEGDVATWFGDHFDPDVACFEPGVVGTLLETAVVLDGLRTLRDRYECGEFRTCRYVLVGLLDRSSVTVNWVRESVETSVEALDLTDVYLDHHTFGMTHQHRNSTVDRRLADVVTAITESFEYGGGTATGGTGASVPDRQHRSNDAGWAARLASQWEDISTHACPSCPYSICCEAFIADEVRFDG